MGVTMPLIDKIKNLALPGVKIADLVTFPDERGSFTEIIRMDWNDFIGNDSIVQANLSFSYPNIVRAWHRHLRGQVDYFFVVKGAAKICAYDDDPKSPTKGHLVEVILSESRRQILRVPGKYWHGYKVIGNEPVFLIYFVTKLYDYSNPDELRRPWNDPTVVPKVINGKEDDIRIGKPWDWFYPPHK